VIYRVDYYGADGYHVISPDGRRVYSPGHGPAAARDAALFAEQCNIEVLRRAAP
jgi:hypothetical protein